MIYTDDIGRKIEVIAHPKRIVSLVPSITELLFALGLGDKIIGLTNFCVHPTKKVSKIEKVGGTKDFSLDKIRELKPDLIIAVKEENNRELILEIAKEFSVFVFDVTSFDSALRMTAKLGELTGAEENSKFILSSIHQKKILLEEQNQILKSACYLIWNKPMMSINKQTFISEMMSFAGFENVFKNKIENYPIILEQEIKSSKAKYILLASEPFLFTEKHRADYQQRFRNTKVILVDGEMFSWYGSRILKAFDYFTSSFVEK